MEELTAANNGDRIYDHEIYVEAQVFDWFRSQPATGKATTVVYSNIVQLKLLGDRARTFKPGQPMDVYVSHCIPPSKIVTRYTQRKKSGCIVTKDKFQQSVFSDFW